MITNVIYAVLVLGVIAVVFGLILSVAAKAFEVKVDERRPRIQACLAGANAAARLSGAQAAPRQFLPVRLPSPPARPLAQRALPRLLRSWAWKPPAVKSRSRTCCATAARPL